MNFYKSVGVFVQSGDTETQLDIVTGQLSWGSEGWVKTGIKGIRFKKQKSWGYNMRTMNILNPINVKIRQQQIGVLQTSRILND